MGQRGNRAEAEFVDGVQRKRPPSRRGQPEERPAASHIDLRVVSMVEIDTNPDFDAWNELLNDIGRRNHAKGTARSLGSLAITYIPAKLMNDMVRDKYSRDYHNDQKKQKLFRKIKSGLDHYIREANGLAYDKKFDEVVGEHEASLARQRELVGSVAAGGLLDVSDYHEPSQPSFANVGLSPEEHLRILEHPFAPVTMKVTKLDTFAGGRKYALDLSTNQPIYEVRNGLIGYLGSEGFQTDHLRRDWEAHATVFDLHDHMKGMPLNRQTEVPDELKFDAPTTEMITIPRQAA